MNLTVKVCRKVHGSDGQESDIFLASRVKLIEDVTGLQLSFTDPRPVDGSGSVDAPGAGHEAWRKYVFDTSVKCSFSVYIENELGRTTQIARAKY